MQALWDNRPLRIFTLGLYAALLALALELVPPANAYLQVGAFIIMHIVGWRSIVERSHID